MSLARFDRETQDAFMSLYKKIDGDPSLNPDQTASQQVAQPTDPNEPPF
jgi:hypothetical protein